MNLCRESIQPATLRCILEIEHNRPSSSVSNRGGRNMEERTKYTMRDVARLAGVSTSTVSAVVNGITPVSPERRKKVTEAMTALDYHPDVVARSLKTGKTNAVGVIVPDITNAFYPEVVRGV